MTPAKKEKAEERPDMTEQTTKVLGIFGGSAVLFYANGFTVVAEGSIYSSISLGLKIYEIVLLVLGVLLFFTTLIAFIYYIFKNRSIKYILLAFFISIVMIAFPALRKIKFGEFELETKGNLSKFREDPSDTLTYKELVNSAMRFDEFHNVGPSALTMFAEVSAITGDTIRAVSLLDSVLRYEPTFEYAMILKSAYLPATIPLLDNGNAIKNLRENGLRQAKKKPEQGEFIKL